MRSNYDNNIVFRFLLQSVIVVVAIAVSFALAHATPSGYEDAKVELTRLLEDKKRSNQARVKFYLTASTYRSFRRISGKSIRYFRSMPCFRF